MKAHEAVEKRMIEVIQQRENDLQTIDDELTMINQQVAAEDQAMKAATERMDVGAYEAAKQNRQKLLTRAEMYQARRNQVYQKELVSETESVEAIESLKAEAQALAVSFENKIEKALGGLREEYTKYMTEAGTIQRVASAWTGNVRANYLSDTTTYRDGTNRSKNPVPVRLHQSKGAAYVKDILDKYKGLQEMRG